MVGVVHGEGKTPGESEPERRDSWLKRLNTW